MSEFTPSSEGLDTTTSGAAPRKDYSLWADAAGNPIPTPPIQPLSTMTEKQRREFHKDMVDGILAYGGTIAIGRDARGQTRWLPEGTFNGITSLGWTDAQLMDVVSPVSLDQLLTSASEAREHLRRAQVETRVYQGAINTMLQDQNATHQAHMHALKEVRSSAFLLGFGVGLIPVSVSAIAFMLAFIG